MKKIVFLVIIIAIITIPVTIVHASNNIYLLADNCDYLLGKSNDPTSTAYLLQEIFDVFKFAAPVLVLVFTTVDYIKALINQEKSDVIKVSGKFAKRLILAAVLFMLPILINTLFHLLGWTGTCGIS